MNTTKNEGPAHVNRLNSISKLKKEGFVGPDASLATSLFEYGICWRKLNDDEKTENVINDEYLFIYGIYGEGSEYYSRFDRVSYFQTNPENKWDWAFKNNNHFLESNSLTIEQFRKFPLQEQINMLYQYFGSEEIFGSNYWEGFKISED